MKPPFMTSRLVPVAELDSASKRAAQAAFEALRRRMAMQQIKAKYPKFFKE